jgi:hypothetical protein
MSRVHSTNALRRVQITTACQGMPRSTLPRSTTRGYSARVPASAQIAKHQNVTVAWLEQVLVPELHT